MRVVRFTRCTARPYRFEPPFLGESYALLLYVAASDVSADEQAAIAAQIIDSGCRYVVCYGDHCSQWHDAVDLAFVVAEKGDKDFVMTTWHDGESAEDVAWFFWNNTSFDDFTAQRMGVFVLGEGRATAAAIEVAVAALQRAD